MADKDFVVKNGLVVNTNLIFANGTSKYVGINNTSPDAALTVTGTANVSGDVTLGAQLAVSGAITTSSNIAVGANVIVNTSVISVGNSTVNTTQNSSILSVSNSSTSSNLSSSDLKIGATVVNASVVTVGANARINTTAVYVGNSTANLVANSTSVFVGNSSVNLVANSSTVIFNNATVVNSSSFTGTAANATLFNNQLPSYYANAENLTSGTLPNARLSSQVVNTSGNFTLSGDMTFTGANIAVSGNVNLTGAFVNVASAFLINSTGAYHTGDINAASHTAGANVVVNSVAVSFIGNTTTSPTITIANTGSFTIGNSSTTQTTALISIANSAGSANISPSGFSGNGYNLSVNASKIDTGTLAWAQAPTGTVNTSGNFTLSGNTTLSGANTTISGNLNVTGTFLNVASAFVVNSIGTYYNGTNLTINSAAIIWSGNTTTSPTVTLANTGSFTIGNSSTTQTGSLISVSNSTGSANISPSGFSGNGYSLKINAANVDSGTLPSARISGAYTGITSVGTLGTLTVTGNTSLTGGLVTLNSNSINANTISIGIANVNFDSGLLFIDAVNNRVGIKNTSPDAELTVTGSANVSGDLRVSGNLVVIGNTVSAGTTEYTGSLNPQSNGVALGNTTKRWNLSAVNGDFSGNVIISTTISINTTALSYSGNTTTLPTITLANTGSFTIGNSSTTQTASIISIANSAGSANISPSGFSGNGINITSINASSITNGTLPSARISGDYAGITQVGTLTGVAVTGNSNFDSGVLFVDGTNNRVGVNTTSPSVTLQIAANDAVIIPIGTTAQRPTGANGMIRYNSNTNAFEGYSGSWKQVSETNGGYYKGNNGAAGNTSNKDNLFRINSNTQSNNITISAGENAMAAGPITVLSGYTLTIETGGRVVIV